MKNLESLKSFWTNFNNELYLKYLIAINTK